jgi:1,4-dihydroxy-6-naphthoate synthase
MGEGYGPMIISTTQSSVEEASESTIAIPGLGTSAYLALRLALGDVNVEVMPFDEILPSVASGKSTHGLIIHEGQLTWKDEGVHLVLDLGVWWNEKTGLPLPLGGNVVLKSHGPEMCEHIATDVRHSIEHAISNPESALSFAKKWGRGISDETNEKFVGMYVNQRTIDYGDDGREAVMRFLEEGQSIGLVDSNFDPRAIDFIGRTHGR